jgi:hypothetical protein
MLAIMTSPPNNFWISSQPRILTPLPSTWAATHLGWHRNTQRYSPNRLLIKTPCWLSGVFLIWVTTERIPIIWSLRHSSRWLFDCHFDSWWRAEMHNYVTINAKESTVRFQFWQSCFMVTNTRKQNVEAFQKLHSSQWFRAKYPPVLLEKTSRPTWGIASLRQTTDYGIWRSLPTD